MKLFNVPKYSVVLCCVWVATTSQAGLFEDDEARKAILDLRQKVESVNQDIEQARKSASEDSASMGKSVLDLQRQIELLRAELATLRGSNETVARNLAELQISQKEQTQLLSDRLAKFEPVKVKNDGVEFLVEPNEKRDFETALTVFRKSDFAAAQNLFVSFVGRYPTSQYVPSALFWLGNAQYASRDYKEAILNFKALISREPDHLRAPEAALSVANCQLELKDAKGARKTLIELLKSYPQSEAAVAAKERLAALK